MSFSINTNIASLQAQNYLQQSSNFQSQTINEVTSGLRIVNSGDDAAGLAIANGFKADETVLTQGIQNANNGLSTLQTIDGGMNNINTLLDRASTLATESASGTFTGDRSTLNAEFQSVIGEINRQAQSIGMNQGGQFAKQLSVFIGGGQGATSAAATANGSINLDLSKSTVDAQSLGLQGVQATGNTSTDIGTGSASTSVQQILANTANTASEKTAGYTTFNFSGPGFGGSNGISVSVNLAGVTDSNTLATAINTAITNAGNGSTQAATAFKNANISASVVTNASGQQQLAFSSTNSAFQVQAGDQTANALLGNFAQNASLTGSDQNASVAGGSFSTLKIDGNSVSLSSATTTALAAGGSKSSIVSALNQDANFSAVATASLQGNQVVIQSNKNGAASSVQVAGTMATALGLSTTTATAASASTGASLNTTVIGASGTANNATLVGGVLGSSITIGTASGSATAAALTSPGAATDANIAALNSGLGTGTATTLLGSSAAPDSGFSGGLNGDNLVVTINGTDRTVALTAGDTSLSNTVDTINTALSAYGVQAKISNPGASQKLEFYSTSSSGGTPTTIAVNGTSSTGAALTATGYTGSETNTLGSTDTLVLNVNGTNQNVKINQGDTSLASVISDINNNTLNPGLGVTASASGSGASQKLVLTTTATGSAANVSVVAAGTSAELLGGTLGFTGGESATGAAAGTSNNSLNVTVGSSSATLTLTSGTYTAAQMVSQLNTQLSANSVAATASLDSSGHLVLQANQAGQSLTLGATSGSAYSTLGLTAGSSSTSAVVTSSDNIQVQFSGAGMSSPVTLKLNPTVAGSTTVSSVLTDLQSQVANNSALAAAGISVTTNSEGNNLVFSDSQGQKFQVAVTGDTNNVLGMGSFKAGANGGFSYDTITGSSSIPTTSQTNTASTGSLNISLNGGATEPAIDVNLKSTSGSVSGTAVADSTVSGAALNGKTMMLDVDGSTKTVTFDNTDTSLAAVAKTINGTPSIGVTADIVGTGANQTLRITSNSSGTASSVTVTGGGTASAAQLTDIGLTAGQSGSGLASAAAVQADAVNQINAAIANNSDLSAAGLQASVNGSGNLVLSSTNGTNFRVSGSGATDLGFGITGGAYTGATASEAPTVGRVDSTGAYTSGSMNFSAIANGADSQTISITATDASGGNHATSITLQNNSTSQSGSNIDSAINAINTQLQQSNDSTLQSIYAVKEDNPNGTESINFMSTTQNFKVAASSLSDGSGVAAPTNGSATATQNGSGANISIDSISGAQAAVNALSTAVQNLGSAQAVIGKGENLLNYATSLAQSQLTNEAASESAIRDANLAQEAANLTKAQILMQAGTAALSQANSAPQQILSLLQGH